MNLTQFDPDPTLFAALKECTESYDVGEPEAEWPNNLLSRRTVVYGNGIIAREGDDVVHDTDPDDLKRCRSLADEARAVIGDIDVGMGSESGDQFSPFFICNNAHATVPTAITEELIRQRFGGTIFPPATISVEPLSETGIWWDEVVTDSDGDDQILSAWRRLMEWFKTHPDLDNPVFVRIGDREELWDAESGELPDGTEITGCVLPRLAVALTQQGSLVGIFGHSVQT